MLSNLSVDQVLTKARSHAKKGEVVEAQKLYEGILQNFSQNKRAQQGLADLTKINQNQIIQDPPQALLDQLINLYNQGHYSVVVEQAEALSNQYPYSFMVWNILSVSAAEIGNHDQAIIAYNKVISLKPDHAEAYSNMGIAFYYKGLLDEAILAFKEATSLNPNYYQAYNNLGNALKDQGKFGEAVDAYKKSILIRPNYAHAYYNMGVAYQEHGELNQAIKAFNKSISLKSDYAEAYSNLGNTLQELGELDKAIEACKKALSLNPNYVEAFNNLGVALRGQGKLDEALEVFNKALALKPDCAEVLSNRAIAFQEQGKVDEPIKGFKDAILLKPDYADAHFTLSFSLFQSGRIKEGLEEYEWRQKTKKGLSIHRHFRQPMWDGQTSLEDKTLFLWCEQGIGDTMNWSYCLPFLTSCSKHVILECQEKLVPLLSRSFPNVEVRSEDRRLDAERDDFDLHLPMGSLYKHFIDEIMEKGKVNSYLIPDPERVKFWKERLSSVGKGPYVGLCWKSSVKSAYRLQHYPPISDWSPVFKIPDITFINLQYIDYEEDIVTIQKEFGVTVHNFKDIDQYDDIDEVAALCSALDVVVSTKATPPMISAGVGTLTKIANWRQSNFNNILNNPQSKALKMIHRDTLEPWDKVFNLIADDILKLKLKSLIKK